MVEENHEKTADELERSIDWKQGFYIALGVPVLVLPSIGFIAKTVWGFGIIIWALSSLQAIFHVTTYGDLASRFPNESGVPGFISRVFGERGREKTWISALGAWGYWIAWTPVLAISTLLISNYVSYMWLPIWGTVPLGLLIGFLLFSSLLAINYFGITMGAKANLLIAIFSIVPLVLLSILPFLQGIVNYSYFTQAFYPPNWSWTSPSTILTIVGLLAIAEWSTGGIETAAVYAAEYKEPAKDTPQALFAAGLVCLITFPLSQAAVWGTLGIEGIKKVMFNPYAPIAEKTLGPIGGAVAILMLITAMILLCNTALNTSSRALRSMAKHGELPKWLGKTNKHGAPVRGMIVVVILNLMLVLLKNPIFILSAGAMGYTLGNAFAHYGFVDTKLNPKRFKDYIKNSFKAPTGWFLIALFIGLLNLPVFWIGLSHAKGLKAAGLGLILLISIFPIWYFVRQKRRSTTSNTSSQKSKELD